MGLVVLAAGARAEFLRGMYTSDWTTFATLHRMGFNTVIGPHGDSEIREARRLGLGIIPSRDAFLPESIRVLDGLRDERAIAAWYPYDEPDLYRVHPETVAEAVRRVKARNPDRPVFLTVWNPLFYRVYAPFADWLAVCPYPITHPGTSPRNRLEQVHEQVRAGREAAGTKPLIAVLQCFFQSPWWPREPEPEELRVMTYLALAAGADGVFQFIWQIGGQDGRTWRLEDRPDLVRELERLNREMTYLEPVLGGGAQDDTRALVSGAPGVFVSPRVHGGWSWVLAANASRQRREVTIRWPKTVERREMLNSARGVTMGPSGTRGIRLVLPPLGQAAFRVRPQGSGPAES